MINESKKRVLCAQGKCDHVEYASMCILTTTARTWLCNLATARNAYLITLCVHDLVILKELSPDVEEV